MKLFSKSRAKLADQRKLEERAKKAGPAQTRTPVHSPSPRMDVATRVMCDHLNSVQVNTRQQLDVLRKTRGQRVVGDVKIPAHLRTADVPLDDIRGVEERGSIPVILGPRD